MVRMNRRSILGLMGGACGLIAAPALAFGSTETGGTAFGTYWRVLTPGRASLVGQQARAVFEAIDREMSPWRADSDLSRINGWAAGDPFPMQPEFARVTAAALDMAAASGGAFDPTVGPLVARHGFGPINGDPDASWRDLRIEAGQLIKTRAGATLDLCGIAKGHAIDALAHRLDAAGLTDWLIDLGGETRARGQHPSGRSWAMAVARPFAPDGEALAALRLEDEAIATSGPGEQSYQVGAARIGHLIDPATGAPVARGATSVTVIAPTAMRADALATALAAMAPGRAATWARARGIAAMVVATDENSAERIVTTGDFAMRRIDRGRA